MSCKNCQAFSVLRYEPAVSCRRHVERSSQKHDTAGIGWHKAMHCACDTGRHRPDDALQRHYRDQRSSFTTGGKSSFQ